MFKEAKRKIVLTILAILCAVLIVTLGMVFVSSYLSVTSQNFEVLREHANMITRDQAPETDPMQEDPAPGPKEENGEEPGGKKEGGGKFDRHLKVGTFYTVKIAPDGTASVIENGSNSIYTDEELISYAEQVTRNRGKAEGLIYLVTEVNGETYICYMDNTVLSDSFTNLFYFTLLFGIAAIIVITFISIALANRIVAPMEENYEKEKQFTADAGHELKTPIAAVSANLELLRREIGSNKWLENIAYENDRMQELVTELLELARNENKTAERTQTDLSRLVNGAVLPLEAAAFDKNILIASDVPDGIMANINEKGIGQLVTILADNAVSHTDSKEIGTTKVNVVLREEKGGPVLTVSNPGEPIPESERERLFERFYRADSAHEANGHYGLGLAIAKAIADANSAKIAVDCEDGFVTFRVNFPAK